MDQNYSTNPPTQDEVAGLEGLAVLEFGTDWCGHCRAAAPLIARALEQRPDVRHIKVEDGKGRPLGRAYGVKLWPTLIFLKNGREAARLTRPTEPQSIDRALAELA